MAIFDPIDVMGPAQRSNQTLQQLAQGAARNVMRRQRLQSLIAQSARGAVAGIGQPFRGSESMRPGGAKSSVLMRLLSGQGANGVGPTHANDGAMGFGGGGYDYPSLPGGDPRQSALSTMPNAISADPTPRTMPGSVVPTSPSGPGFTPAGSGGATGGGSGEILSGGATGGGSGEEIGNGLPAGAANLIHLGNGIYYDVASDSVVNGNHSTNNNSGIYG